MFDQVRMLRAGDLRMGYGPGDTAEVRAGRPVVLTTIFLTVLTAILDRFDHFFGPVRPRTLAAISREPPPASARRPPSSRGRPVFDQSLTSV